ncbi:MAG: MFS transporter [Rhodoblastus sp.]
MANIQAAKAAMRPPTVSEATRLLTAAAIGTIVEWYDFFVFATCAVLVFNKTFFPASDPYTGILLGLATYAVGFAARPIGGLIFGNIGDKFGRKQALVASMFLMGGATFAMGLLPDYAAIGVAAPLLLVLLRILQGLAVGGEATGALTLVAESMPAKHRGFWVSFPMIGGPAANVLAALTIIAVQKQFGSEAFVAWAWRLPFLASIVLVVLGLWVRRRIEESPAFVAFAQKSPEAPAPIKEACTQALAPMTRVFLVKAAENTLFYLFTTFLLVFVTQFLAQPRGVGLDALFWGSLLEVPVIMIAAYVADRIGRRPVMLAGIIGAAVTSFLLFAVDKTAPKDTILHLVLVALSFHGLIVGAMAPFFAEQFATRVRYTAMSLSYQLASVFGGSIAPIIGTLLLERTGHASSVPVYAAIVAVPAIVAIVLSRETRGTDLLNVR